MLINMQVIFWRYTQRYYSEIYERMLISRGLNLHIKINKKTSYARMYL